MAATRTPTARQFFTPRGILSQWHPNHEFRAGPARNGRSRRGGAGREPASHRRGRHRDRQDAGLPDSGDPGRQAHRHLHRHQEPPGTALLQGRPVPAAAPRPAAPRLLHEGPRQLRLPPEDLRRREGAGPLRTRRGRRLPDHPRLGEDHRDRRPRRDLASCPRRARPPGPSWTPAASAAPARSASSSSAASSPRCSSAPTRATSSSSTTTSSSPTWP